MERTKRVLKWSAASVLAVAIGVGGYTAAGAGGTPSGEAPAGKTRASEHTMPNLGQVKTQIQEYYGDEGAEEPSRDSDFARELAFKRKIVKAKLKAGLAGRDPEDGRPAVVFDVDDTTLSTYNYEVTHDFGYDKQENADYIKEHGMDPIFGMPEITKWAEANGVEVFYLTGRPEDQRSYTARDLAKGGFVNAQKDRMFLRNKANPPSYLEYCEPDCTTVQYKSGTRGFIERQGYDVLLTVGDQYSDLEGGHADSTVKIPNPMYFLP